MLPDVWYFKTILDAKSAGLLAGLEDDTSRIYPDQAIMREEMATILGAILRQQNVPTTGEMIYLDQVFNDYVDMDAAYIADIELVYQTNLMIGTGNGKFDPKGVATRAQAAAVQIRLLEILKLLD